MKWFFCGVEAEGVLHCLIFDRATCSSAPGNRDAEGAVHAFICDPFGYGQPRGKQTFIQGLSTDTI